VKKKSILQPTMTPIGFAMINYFEIQPYQ